MTLERSAPIARTRVKARRDTPRRRDAPEWTRDEWETAEWQLTARSNGCCERCRVDLTGPLAPPAERHHRVRRRDGGDRLANLLLLCRTCHAWITEHPAFAVEHGWIVPVTTDPATVPVRLADERLWLLRDDGTKIPSP